MATAPLPTKTNTLPDTGTVTVACKLPHGLILRVFEQITVPEPVMGGGLREVQVARALPREVVINGYAVPLQGPRPDKEIIGGYALTFGVDAAFFKKWMEQNKDAAFVKNNLVFAHVTDASARDQAKDGEGIRTGVEPIDPDNPGSKVTKADVK